MTDLRTARLVLHPVDADEAERIVAGHAGPDDTWSPDFPFQGDVVGATMFLRATAAHGEQQPFGHYVVVRASDGVAVGGVGFKGGPRDGTVEIGYGLAPSGRGNGYAAEAVRALADLAREHGVTRLVADTAADNVASQKTLLRAGFVRTGTTDDLVDFELDL